MTHASRGLAALRFVAVELAVWIALYGLYLLVRGLSVASADEALANARAIVDAERAAGLLVEAQAQSALGGLHDAASAYYVAGFAPLLVGVLGWLALRHRDVYRELRLLLLVSIGLALVIHVALPVAPPRLVPELSLLDTVGLDRDGSSFAGIPFNPYAAMPSMHVGWSLLVGVFAFRAAHGRLTRSFFAAHPLLMVLAVTITGNHFVLDSLAGAAVALAAPAALALWRLEPEPACVPLRL
jgi:PAP2 superfamily